MTAEQLEQARPMYVLADDSGRPLTADYDFLAKGMKGQMPVAAFRYAVPALHRRHAYPLIPIGC